MIKQCKGYKIICYFDSKLILSKGNFLYKADQNFGNKILIAKLSFGCHLKNFLSRFRFFQRALRLEIGPAIQLNSREVLVFAKTSIFKVNIRTRKVILETKRLIKNRPLNITKVEKGLLKDYILFGEYEFNPNFEPVRIYGRSPSSEWKIIYTFDSSKINHIHNIVEDKHSNKFYILSGDFKNGAAFWETNDSFKSVKCILNKGQNSRACWLFQMGNEFVYATDSQTQINKLYKLNMNQAENISHIKDINGPSIFACNNYTNKFFFSTSVEPISLSTNRHTINGIFSSKLAPAMVSDCSYLYSYSFTSGAKILFNSKKDILPFRLFQFGNIIFPNGKPVDESLLYFYCVGLKDFDNVSICLKI